MAFVSLLFLFMRVNSVVLCSFLGLSSTFATCSAQLLMSNERDEVHLQSVFAPVFDDLI